MGIFDKALQNLGLGDAFEPSGGGNEQLPTKTEEQQEFLKSILGQLQGLVPQGLTPVDFQAAGPSSLQQQAYRDMADLYANQEYEKADFSYFVQAEQQALARQQEAQTQKREEKTDMFGNILGGAAIGASFGPVGAAVGGAVGLLSSWF